MTPLNLSELQLIISKLQTLTGSRLQEIRSGANWYELTFYYRRELHPVLIELSNKSPALLPIAAPSSWKSKKTPTQLFIHAHVRDKYLTEVRLVEGRGRVVELLFDNGATMELRLYPHGQNLIVRHEDKQVSHFKVLPEAPAVTVHDQKVRSLDEICNEFLRDLLKVAQPNQAPSTNQIEKAILKKKTVRDKIAADIEEKRKIPLREVGEWLKVHQSLSVPDEWQKFVDLRLSFSENLQNVFAAAKELDQKIARAEERLITLDSEIAALSEGDISGIAVKVNENQSAKNSMLHAAGVRGRTFETKVGHKMYVGRSGVDNLRLLREASAWDYWLHLKDEPGSHGILRRQKGEKITDAEFLECLNALVKATYGDKSARHDGDKFAGLIVECRYVKPIKGDRLGRVNYRNERVLNFIFRNA